VENNNFLKLTEDFVLEKLTVNFTWPNGKENLKPVVVMQVLSCFQKIGVAGILYISIQYVFQLHC